VTARRAKRENGGLGEDPLGSGAFFSGGTPQTLRARFARAYESSFLGAGLVS
jgi:hypothetical protein